MARLIGPDEASREVKAIVGKTFRSKDGSRAQLWSDDAATIPADVLTEAGAAIPQQVPAGNGGRGMAPTVTIDSSSMLPLIQYPDGVDFVVVTCDGGPPWRAYARTDDRLDGLAGRVGTVEGVAAGLGNAATRNVGTTASTVAAGDAPAAAVAGHVAATDPHGDRAYVNAQMLTPEQFGAAGNGITDDTAALVAWLAAGNTGIALRPGRKYLTSVPLTLPGTVKTLAGNGATIAATNDSGSPILAKTSTGTVSYVRISDVTFDCASHMDGPRFAAISQSELSGIIVRNPILTGLTIGDAAGTKSNGNRLYDVRVEFAVQPANSVGLLLAKANDTHVVSLEVFGAYTGVLVDSQSSGGIFVAPHVWGFTGNLPNTCYDISGATTMFHPHADTPSTFGYRFRANSPHRLVEPEIFINPSYGNDNTVIAFKLDDFVNISITGPQFIGGDATHRIAADIEGPQEFVRSSNPYYFQTVIQRLVPTPLRRAWQPEYSGYKGWTFDPAGAGSTGSIPAQGAMQIIRLPWQPGEKITSIYTAVVAAGSGLTANQCLLGVYDMSGNLLGTTVNAATTWQATGVRQHDLTTPARCNDPYVDVAFYWNGTTGPTLLRGNTGGYAGNGRYATADTSLTTALPATMGTRATGFTSWWVAVS